MTSSDNNAMPDTKPFGVSQVEPEEGLPVTRAELRVGRADLKACLAKNMKDADGRELSPAMQISMLRAYDAIKKAAIRTLHVTIYDETYNLHLLQPDELEMPTDEELLEIAGIDKNAAKLVTPSEQELADIGNVRPVLKPSDKERQALIEDTTHTRDARLKELQALAMDIAEEGTFDMLQHLNDVFVSIKAEDLYKACEDMESLQFATAQTVHALCSQQAKTAYNAQYGHKDATKLVMDGLQEAMQARLEYHLDDLPTADDKLRLLQTFKGLNEMFFKHEQTTEHAI